MHDFCVNPGESIQAAIDEAFKQGGGRVVAEPGIHPVGTIYLKSNVELHLPAGTVLRGGDSLTSYDLLPKEIYGEYAPCNASSALIVAHDAENIAVTGSGIVDGQGPLFYDCNIPDSEFFYRKPDTGRPRLLQLVRCKDIRLEGVEFRNSPGWTTWLIECENIRIHGLRIFGDPRMINNDGIHLFGGHRVVISDCMISTGDDAIVIRAGHAWENMARSVISEDVVVTNCVLESSCQGIRVGCSCDDTVRRCRFSNLTIRSRNVGIYIDNPARYLVVACKGPAHEIDDISFDHISVESGTKALAVEVEEGVRLKRIGRISFHQIDFKSREPLSFTGCRETPLEEIVLNHVRGTVSDPENIRSRFVKSFVLNDVDVRH